MAAVRNYLSKNKLSDFGLIVCLPNAENRAKIRQRKSEILLVHLLSTNATLVCDLPDFKSAFCLFCSRSDISCSDGATPIGVKFHIMVHIGPGRCVSPFGGGTPVVPKIPNFRPKFWPFNRDYLENGKSRRYMSTRP